jgi:hypothetical protein
VTQLVHLSLVAIVEVLPGAEDLDLRDTGLPDAVKPDRGESMLNADMRGENVVH